MTTTSELFPGSRLEKLVTKNHLHHSVKPSLQSSYNPWPQDFGSKDSCSSRYHNLAPDTADGLSCNITPAGASVQYWLVRPPPISACRVGLELRWDQSTKTSESSLTCRTRRVKCDEGRPSCVNCSKKDRECRYGSQDSAHVQPRRQKRKTSDSRGSDAASELSAGTPRPQRSRAEIEGNSVSFTIDDPHTPTVNALDATVISLDEQAAEAGHGPAAAQPELHAVSSQAADARGVPLGVEHPEILSPFSFTLGSILLGADHAHHQNDFPAPRTLAIEPSSQFNEERLAPCTTLRVEYQIQLSDTEVYVFRNYVDNVSHWVSGNPHVAGIHDTLLLEC